MFEGERAQAELNRLLSTTTAELDELRAGVLPPSLRRRHVSPYLVVGGPGAPTMIIGSVVFAVLGALADSGWLRTGLLVSTWACLLVAVWQSLRRARMGLRARRVYAGEGRMRRLSGTVRTVRSWSYGYGDVYHLFVELRVDDGAPLWVSGDLDQHMISGECSVYVAVVPRLDGSGESWLAVVGVDASETTRLEQRPPGRPPPAETLLIGAPAD